MLSFLRSLILFVFRFFFLSVVGLIFFGLLLWLIGLVWRDKPAKILPKSFLVIDWSQGLIERPIKEADLSDRILDQLGLYSSNAIALWDLNMALECAAKDGQIAGILMTGCISDTQPGFAQLNEAREALKQFRKSGKPVISYMQLGMGKDYYLLSECDQFFMHPHGALVFSGISMESPFFSEAMERYGVGLQEARAGEYKSALEPFTRSDFSPETREANQLLLDDFWAQLLSEVADSRHLSIDALKEFARQGPIANASEVFDRQLVDKLLHFDELLDLVTYLGSEDPTLKSFAQVNLSEYLRQCVHSEKNPYTRGPKIAIVYAEGALVDAEGGPDQVGGDHFARIIRSLRKDEEISGIVLRINSGGGSSLAAELIAREVELSAQEKPLVVSLGDVAASGGYWIASQAPFIFSSPFTTTGSIGSFAFFGNIELLAKNHGVTFDSVKTEPFAGCLNTYSQPKSAEAMTCLQSFVDKGYADFIKKVATGRHLSLEEVEKVAKGRVWSGIRAKELALVDNFGTLTTAVSFIASHLDAEHYRVVHIGPDYTIGDRLTSYGQGIIPFIKTLKDYTSYMPFLLGDRNRPLCF